MTRLLYGGSGGDLIAKISADGDYTPASSALTVWYDTDPDGSNGTQETDLLDEDGATPISAVTMPTSGPPRFYGKDGFEDSYILRDSDGKNWRVDPSDLASRTGNVSKVTFNGVDHTGPVTIPDVTWANLEAGAGFPSSIAAGDTPEEARSEIGAISADDIPTVAGLGSIPGVSTSGGNPGDALIQNSDDTLSVQPIPLPLNFKPIITKDEGDPTPTGTAADTFIFVLAGVGTTWGYGTDVGGAGATGSPTTCTLTLTSPVPVGTLLAIGVSADAAGGVQSNWSAADDHSGSTNVYTQDVRHIQGNTNQTAILHCEVATALDVGDHITVTSDITRAQIAIKAATVVGSAASPLDKTATGGAASSASQLAGPTATTSQTDEIIFVVVGYQSSGITFTPTNGLILAGSPVDSAATTSRRGCIFGYKILTATGTPSGTGNTSLTAGGASQTVNYSACIATFKKA